MADAITLEQRVQRAAGWGYADDVEYALRYLIVPTVELVSGIVTAALKNEHLNVIIAVLRGVRARDASTPGGTLLQSTVTAVATTAAYQNKASVLERCISEFGSRDFDELLCAALEAQYTNPDFGSADAAEAQKVHLTVRSSVLLLIAQQVGGAGGAAQAADAAATDAIVTAVKALKAVGAAAVEVVLRAMSAHWTPEKAVERFAGDKRFISALVSCPSALRLHAVFTAPVMARVWPALDARALSVAIRAPRRTHQLEVTLAYLLRAAPIDLGVLVPAPPMVEVEAQLAEDVPANHPNYAALTARISLRDEPLFTAIEVLGVAAACGLVTHPSRPLHRALELGLRNSGGANVLHALCALAADPRIGLVLLRLIADVPHLVGRALPERNVEGVTPLSLFLDVSAPFEPRVLQALLECAARCGDGVWDPTSRGLRTPETLAAVLALPGFDCQHRIQSILDAMPAPALSAVRTRGVTDFEAAAVDVVLEDPHSLAAELIAAHPPPQMPANPFAVPGVPNPFAAVGVNLFAAPGGAPNPFAAMVAEARAAVPAALAAPADDGEGDDGDADEDGDGEGKGDGDGDVGDGDGDAGDGDGGDGDDEDGDGEDEDDGEDDGDDGEGDGDDEDDDGDDGDDGEGDGMPAAAAVAAPPPFAGTTKVLATAAVPSSAIAMLAAASAAGAGAGDAAAGGDAESAAMAPADEIRDPWPAVVPQAKRNALIPGRSTILHVPLMLACMTDDARPRHFQVDGDSLVEATSTLMARVAATLGWPNPSTGTVIPDPATLPSLPPWVALLALAPYDLTATVADAMMEARSKLADLAIDAVGRANIPGHAHRREIEDLQGPTKHQRIARLPRPGAYRYPLLAWLISRTLRRREAPPPAELPASGNPFQVRKQPRKADDGGGRFIVPQRAEQAEALLTAVLRGVAQGTWSRRFSAVGAWVRLRASMGTASVSVAPMWS